MRDGGEHGDRTIAGFGEAESGSDLMSDDESGAIHGADEVNEE